MGKRVLFVEDDPSLLFLYRRTFSRLGYEVLLANDSSQALEVFERCPPDALVVDVRLAGDRDGLDFLRKVLLIRRVPSVINTAYASYRDSFLSWAADAYVLKSSDLTELSDTVGRLLSREEAPNARTAPKAAALSPLSAC